jgi:hypothetical protein
MTKTRLAWLPLIFSLLGPGPSMSKFLVIVNASLVKVMVPVTLKVIVSPAAASTMAWRKEPGPLSLRFFTESVAALLVLVSIALASTQAAMAATKRTTAVTFDFMRTAASFLPGTTNRRR